MENSGSGGSVARTSILGSGRGAARERVDARVRDPAAAGGAALLPLRGHAGLVNCLATVSDPATAEVTVAPRLASLCAPKHTVRLWDPVAPGGAALVVLVVDELRGVLAVTSDGRGLAAATGEGLGFLRVT